jgi:hypothetical protein
MKVLGSPFSRFPASTESSEQNFLLRSRTSYTRYPTHESTNPNSHVRASLLQVVKVSAGLVLDILDVPPEVGLPSSVIYQLFKTRRLENSRIRSNVLT